MEGRRNDTTSSAALDASSAPYAWWGEIPARLLASARVGELNLLVGAGVSMDVGLPSWESMLRSVAAALPPEPCGQVEGLIDASRLLDAAELLRRYLIPQDLCHALRDSLGHAQQPGPLHLAAWRLHPRALLTTNFDGLLEHAYAREALQAPHICRGLDVEPPDCLRPEGVLFKLHGDLEVPSTLVLSRNDYLRSLGAMPGSRISSVFAHRPTLAIGYSLRDPDLQLLFHNLNSAARGFAQPLYLVIPEQPRAELDLLQCLGSVSVLQYPRELRPRDALLAFLERLASARAKQRYASAQTPGSIAVSKYVEQRTAKAHHDVQNLLTVLLWNATLLERLELPSEARRIVSETVNTVNAAAATTRAAQSTVAALAQGNRPTPWAECESVLRELLKQPQFARVAASLSASEDIRLPLGPNLYALLVEILLNHAVDGCREVPQPSIRLSVHLAGSNRRQLVTTVTDNGSGIDGSMGSNAFLPGSTHGARTDNGLFSLVSVVEECGGSINLSSEPGKGTSIVIRLPFVAAPGSVTASAMKVVVAPKPTEQLEIVVIDDDSMLADATSQHLTAEGYSVTCFDDPRIAMDSIRMRTRAPDLVICDIVMPNLSGYELADLVRERFPALRFVFVSAFVSHPSSGSESEVFMTKPVNARALVKHAKQLTRA